MRSVIMILILIPFCLAYTYGQDKTRSKNQTKTIEIDNDNGELFISFENNVITKFVVNDKPVPKELYNDYQKIIDDFSDEGTEPTIPEVPEPPTSGSDTSQELYDAIIDQLAKSADFKMGRKIKLELKTKHLKVNGKIQSSDNHEACLAIFEDIYGHRLNEKSTVKFKKSKNNSSSTIDIRK